METFRWRTKHYDISRLLADLQDEVIKPALIDLSREFVARYGQMFLIRGEANPVAINIRHVLSKSQAMLNRPAVLLHVGDDGGLITFDEEHGTDANWIVGDGNHRVLAAGLERCG
jgi:hypothetical protein